MSITSINNEITNMQTQTAMTEAAKPKVTGTSDLGQDAFMKLMLLQLKNQDPLSPMDNKDFLAQQAQMTQVNEAQKLNNQIAQNNSIMQSLSLVGKQVTLQDPDNRTKTITGTVTEASFENGSTAIKVNDKNYPITLVMGVKDPTVAPTPTPPKTDTQTKPAAS